MTDNALQRATLTVAMLTSFMTPFMGAAVNLALPASGAELGLDAVMLSWTATAYVVAAVVSLLPFGRLADIHGRLSIIALTHGLSALPAGRGYVWLAMAVAGLALFVWRELLAPSPLIDLRLLRDNRAFAFSNLAALVNYAATFAVGFLVSLYLQYVRGLPPREALRCGSRDASTPRGRWRYGIQNATASFQAPPSFTS